MLQINTIQLVLAAIIVFAAGGAATYGTIEAVSPTCAIVASQPPRHAAPSGFLDGALLPTTGGKRY